jgi:hypothetical protein
MIMERALFGEDASEKPRDHVISCIVVISHASTFFLIFALGLCIPKTLDYIGRPFKPFLQHQTNQPCPSCHKKPPLNLAMPAAVIHMAVGPTLAVVMS